MRAQDFDSRFEDTLKANRLEYTVERKTENLSGIGWEYKDFLIKSSVAHHPDVRVSLIRTVRPVRYGSVGRTSHKCFVIASYGRKRPVARFGLRNVWLEIKLVCS
jgi:hypothetical protein